MAGADQVDRPAVAAALAAKHAELVAELRVLTTPPDASASISFGKRVGDGTAMAVERYANVSVHERLRAVLADVERAQAKLAEGTYGVCDRCREPIAAERLAVRAWAVRCVRCASR